MSIAAQPGREGRKREDEKEGSKEKGEGKGEDQRRRGKEEYERRRVKVEKGEKGRGDWLGKREKERKKKKR